jgi:hypothetical protein
VKIKNSKARTNQSITYELRDMVKMQHHFSSPSLNLLGLSTSTLSDVQIPNRIEDEFGNFAGNEVNMNEDIDMLLNR